MNPRRNLKYILFRNDDLCALSDPPHERKILELFERYHIPQVVGVVPQLAEWPHDSRCDQYHPLEENSDILNLVKEYQKKGLIEIAQHGWRHQTNAQYPSRNETGEVDNLKKAMALRWQHYDPLKNEYSEFKGLPYDEAKSRIAKGKATLERLFGIPIKTFIFPWNTFEDKDVKILHECGFENLLCGGEKFTCSSDMKLIYHSREDLLSNGTTAWKILNGVQSQRSSTLLHLLYHSWMVSDKEIGQWEEALRDLSENENVECIMTEGLVNLKEELKIVLPLSCMSNWMNRKANHFLKKKIPLVTHYVLNPVTYIKYILKALGIIFIGKLIRMKKVLVVVLAIFLLLIIFLAGVVF